MAVRCVPRRRNGCPQLTLNGGRSVALLLQAETRLERLVSLLPGMLFEFEMDVATGRHSYLYVSSGSRALFERTPDEIIADGSRITDSIHPGDKQRYDEALRAGGCPAAQNVFSLFLLIRNLDFPPPPILCGRPWTSFVCSPRTNNNA